MADAQENEKKRIQKRQYTDQILQRIMFFLGILFVVVFCAEMSEMDKRRKADLDEADERERHEQQQRNTTNSGETDGDRSIGERQRQRH